MSMISHQIRWWNICSASDTSKTNYLGFDEPDWQNINFPILNLSFYDFLGFVYVDNDNGIHRTKYILYIIYKLAGLGAT